jgi:hypothetical protein
MKPYICTKYDWDCIDVFLITEDEELPLKGFDEEEWREAQEYAERIAYSLNIEYVGDRTDT